MSISKYFFFILVVFSGFSQRLHHQMLSSQGISTQTSGGIRVCQSIGQNSAIGNYRNTDVIVGQGFIQSNIMKTTQQPNVIINTTAYPNPFIDRLNFQFSSPISGPIKVALFDIMGRLIYYEERMVFDTILTIDNLSFAEGEYFAKLTANNFTYSTNLLKFK